MWHVTSSDCGWVQEWLWCEKKANCSFENEREMSAFPSSVVPIRTLIFWEFNVAVMQWNKHVSLLILLICLIYWAMHLDFLKGQCKEITVHGPPVAFLSMASWGKSILVAGVEICRRSCRVLFAILRYLLIEPHVLSENCYFNLTVYHHKFIKKLFPISWNVQKVFNQWVICLLKPDTG